MQLETTAYAGVKSSAHVGYSFPSLISMTNGSLGRCRPSEIGTNDTKAARIQIAPIVDTATYRVTQRVYLHDEWENISRFIDNKKLSFINSETWSRFLLPRREFKSSLIKTKAFGLPKQSFRTSHLKHEIRKQIQCDFYARFHVLQRKISMARESGKSYQEI